jgi:hypothetical protein
MKPTIDGAISIEFPDRWSERFFGEVYDDPSEFLKLYMTEPYLFVAATEIYKGNTFVEVGDDNMWCETVVIRGEWSGEQIV